MKKGILTISVIASMTLANVSMFGQNAPTTTDQSQAAPAVEFKPSGTVTGQVFGDYFMKMHADSSLSRGSVQYSKVPKNYDAFQFRRILFGYDYQFSEHFSAQIALANENDATNDASGSITSTSTVSKTGAVTTTTTQAAGQRTVYIKAANLRWKNFVKNNDLVLGQTSTPFFALLSESIWGYRSIEKTVADQRGFCKSNDFGVALQGKLNDKGDYGYNFMIANGGNGGQYVETDKYKKGYGEIYAKFLDQKIIIDLAGTYEPSSIALKQSKTTSKIFVAYQTKMITAGFEGVMQTQANAATDTTTGKKNATQVNVTPFAFSVFVRGQIIENKLNYFARYDSYNPNTNYKASDLYSTSMTTNKEGFITAGLDWTPTKNVHLMPNIWYDSFSTMKNNVKGTLAKSDYDMVVRLTAFYKF